MQKFEFFMMKNVELYRDSVNKIYPKKAISERKHRLSVQVHVPPP